MEKRRCYGCMNLKTEVGICPHCGYDDRQTNEEHQLPTGTVLKEQYLVGKVLGQGGFGITYMGWDMYLDIPVAIKEYFPGGTVMRNCTESTEVVTYNGETGERFLQNKERFMREVKMLARFQDVKEIVQVKNFFLANNTAYIVMEYVEGITLKEYVKRNGGRLPVDEVLTLLYPVMDGLAQVHKTGLVHRDISPENIMILPNGKVKLLDFGAVRDVGNASVDRQLTHSTEAILKQGYAPMEQYQNRGRLGPWTDVYALCATIYYSLTGEIPPDAPERILGEKIKWFTEKGIPVQKAIEQVVKDGMELRVEERIPDMETLHQRFLLAQGTADTKIKTKKADGWLQKKYAGYMLLAVGVLACVALAVCFYFAGRHAAVPDKNTETESVQAQDTERKTDGEMEENVCGSGTFYSFDSATGELRIFGTGTTWDVVQPGTTELTEWETERIPWEEEKENIRRLVIENGVSYIGRYNFKDCVNLSEVEWGSVEYISEGAFENAGLTALEFPDSLQQIDSRAFAGCKQLTEVKLPESLAHLYPETFSNTALNQLYIGRFTELFDDAGVTPFTEYGKKMPEIVFHGYTGSKAEEYANRHSLPFVSVGFYENYALEGKCGEHVSWRLEPDTGEMTISGTGMIYDYVDPNVEAYYSDDENYRNEHPPWYEYRRYIRTLTIGPEITRIGNWAFYNCTNLETVDWGNVEEIGMCSFNHANISELKLPETVRSIEAHAFGNLSQLTEVELPASLETLGNSAFVNCQNLEKLVFQSKVILNLYGEEGIFGTRQDMERNGCPVIYGPKEGEVKVHAMEFEIPYVVLDEEK